MQKKLTIVLFACLFLLDAWAQQETYHIKGKIGNVDEPVTFPRYSYNY